MRTGNLRWWSSGGAAILLCLATSRHQPYQALAAASVIPSGHWRGSGRAIRSVDLKLAALVMSTQSDFWFTVSQAGDIDGAAVSCYQLVLDDGTLRTRLGWVTANANTAIALVVPGILAFLGPGTSTKDLVGISVSLDEPMPVRSGRLTGKLAGNTIHLSWATPPPQIPYKRYAVYATREQLQASNTMGAFGPWTSDATISEIAPGEFEAAVDPSQSQTTGGDARISAVWTAYRVNSH